MRRHHCLFILALASLAFSCSKKEKYDIARYYDRPEQDSLLMRVVSHLYVAPGGVRMEDRFKKEHYPFYWMQAKTFRFIKFYRAESGVHYYYVERPTAKIDEYRGVGGTFTTASNGELKDFREIFVTPVLSDTDIRGRCSFLFEKLVEEGNIDKYIAMPSYVAWPSAATYYDTVTYEWKLKQEFEK